MKRPLRPKSSQDGVGTMQVKKIVTLAAVGVTAWFYNFGTWL
jgi:hypothetical protein